MLYTRPPKVEEYKGDLLENDFKALVVPVPKSGDKPDLEGVAADIDKAVGRQLSEAIKLGQFKGEAGEILKVFGKGKLIVYVGLGDRKASAEKLAENTRVAYAAASDQLVETVERALVVVDGDGDIAREAVIGSLLAAYRFEAFKSEKKAKLSGIAFNVDGRLLEEALAIAEGVYLARDLANAPPHEVSPPKLAEKLSKLFGGLEGVEVEVFDYERLVKEGFGGIVNVGKGSEEKPRLIILKYNWGKGKPIALVGKTMVFDSGGINLKPSQSLFEMRADKAGGAAVAGVLWSVARLKLPISVVALIPAAMNVPSGTSYLPSDVIRMWDGTYVEVTNTDAEGRLTLADAIAYAAKALEAEEIIDLATLTGAAWIALGPLIAALFTSNDKLADRLQRASAKTGEKIWRLPLEEAYKRLLSKKAPLADIANAVARGGGAITAALFLERFAKGKPFAHIDIAGPGIGLEAQSVAPQYWPKGLAPGFGVRLILEYLRSKTGAGQGE